MKVKEMGATVVRIPIHPVAWRERTPEQYLLLLDQAVEWCTELQMYIVIDWHSIVNLKAELFQNPMYNTSMTETYEFWRAIAQR
jgi:endoglucanase